MGSPPMSIETITEAVLMPLRVLKHRFNVRAEVEGFDVNFLQLADARKNSPTSIERQALRMRNALLFEQILSVTRGLEAEDDAHP